MSPPDLRDCKSYEVYREELAIWETIKDIPKEKQGATLAARLPYESKLKKDLKDKSFESVDVIDLAKEGGLRLVKVFLEKELGEVDLEKHVRTWDSCDDEIDLAKEGNLRLVKEFLERELGEVNLEKQVRIWNCTRGTNDIEDFLSDEY